jgi:GT2 family glycosyltransferase
MTELSIIITNFNSKQYLYNCIASITSDIGGTFEYEVIVVDDASNDGSQEMVREKFPAVMLISNDKNIGYIASNNKGIKMSKGHLILCLNNDTVIKKGAIKGLMNLIKAHPDAGAVGPKLINSDGTIQYQCRRSFPSPLNSFLYFSGVSRLFPKSRVFGAYLMTYLDDDLTVKVDALCGAAMMLKRDVIDSVGVMDEGYFMYGDDIDWCYRIKNAGWNIYYYPASEIIHYGGRGGSRKMPYQNIYRFHMAMAIYHKKHNAKSYPWIVNMLVYTGIWLKFVLSVFASILRKDKYVGTKKP